MVLPVMNQFARKAVNFCSCLCTGMNSGSKCKPLFSHCTRELCIGASSAIGVTLPLLPPCGKAQTRGVEKHFAGIVSGLAGSIGQVEQRGQPNLFRQDFRFAGRDKSWVIVIGTDHNYDSILIYPHSALGNCLTACVDVNVGSNRQIGPDGVLAVRSAAFRRGVWCRKIGDGVVIGCAVDSDRCDPADGHRFLGIPLVIDQLK